MGLKRRILRKLNDLRSFNIGKNELRIFLKVDFIYNMDNYNLYRDG